MSLWMISRIVWEVCKPWGSESLKEWLDRASSVLGILNNVAALLMLFGISYSIRRALQTREDSTRLITTNGTDVDELIEEFYNEKLQESYTVDSGYHKGGMLRRPKSSACSDGI